MNVKAGRLLGELDGVARYARGHASFFIRLLRRRPVRYIRITPGLSFLKAALVLDLRKKRLIKLLIRSRTESIVVDQILVDRCYDTSVLRRHADIVARYEEIIAAGKVPLVLDCGGNIGIASFWFQEEFPDAKVVCVEPSLENLAAARKNAPDADCLHAAVGSEVGVCEIQNPDANSWAYKVTKSQGKTPLLTIERILEDYPAETFTPFMIKIDIEGFEADLFSKATGWIDEFHLLMVELHDWLQPNSATSSTFLRSISQYKRDFVPIGENIFSIKCSNDQDSLT